MASHARDRSPGAFSGAATTPAGDEVAAIPGTVTLLDSESRAADDTRDSDPDMACHDNSQDKEEQGQKHEEANTDNHGPCSTSDQESSLNSQQDEDFTSVDELQEQIREMEIDIQNTEKVENLESQLIQKEKEIEEKNKIIEMMQQKEAELEEDVEHIRRNVDREIAEREKEDRTNNLKINSLRKQLNETVKEKSSLQQELQRVTFELSEEKKEKDKQLKTSQQEIRKKDARIDMVERQSSTLMNENKALETRLKKSQSSADQLQKQYTDTLNQLLVTSVEANNVPVVVQALKNGADVHTPSCKHGHSPLHLAAARGHTDIVQHLLQKGAWASSEDRFGRNAAHCAAAMGHLEVLKTLDTQAPQAITQQETLLRHTVENGHLEASEWLLAKGTSYDWPSSMSQFFTFNWWNLMLALWLLQTGRLRRVGMAVPIYMVLYLLVTLKWLWPGTSGNVKQEENGNHYVEPFMEDATLHEVFNTKTGFFHSMTNMVARFWTATKRWWWGDMGNAELEEEANRYAKDKYGLPNLGNTCYMNCVLQCLYYTQPLTDHFRDSHHGKREGDMTTAYRTLCHALNTGRDVRRAAEKMKELAGRYDSTFKGKQQQEAHDFLSSLLTWLHEDLTKHSNTGLGFLDKSVVSELFFGTHQSTVTCSRRREVVNRTEETFINLSLPVTEYGQNYLQKLLAEHYREQNIVWECHLCGVEHECVQKTSILDPPELLIIHLSRYVQGQPTHKKLKVTYPEDGLTLGKRKYRLYALCDHAGVMSFGHYTAFCHTSWEDDAAPWLLFNDISVWQTDPEEPLNCHTAHILFYKSIN